MARAMFGAESEYAIAGVRGKKAMDRDELVGHYIRAARSKLVHLPDSCSPSGIFLVNGGRFYFDCGHHPEMSTPECTDPIELARYIKAGERVLAGLTQQVQAESGEGAEVMCFGCNVDYSGSGSTWGAHESFLHRANPASLPEQLISHLVTRVIYTGAGGFNPLSNNLEFAVAPRLMHIQQVISGESTGNRGIFHTKNESLSGKGNNRLHILCGENLYSETAMVLKIGATALVVAMAEEGLKPGAWLQLASPLEALRAVATDVTCGVKLPLAAGGEKTAIEIQRGLLELAERNRGVLPPWASGVCALWRRTLDQLEDAPDSVATILDWAIKRRLFENRAARGGVAWERFGFLNAVTRRLNTALTAAGVEQRVVRVAVLLGPKCPVPEEVAKVEAVLKNAGLGWDVFDRFLELRGEFYQIDTRFGQLGPRGIFSELDRLGVLNHKVEGVDGPVDNIDAAMQQPPAVGRARLRGEAIRRLSGQSGAVCDWMSVRGPDGRRLDLSDPFAATEVWSEPAAGAPGDAEEGTFELLDEGGDPGRFQQMLDAFRGRHGRARGRAQRTAETTESSDHPF